MPIDTSMYATPAQPNALQQMAAIQGIANAAEQNKLLGIAQQRGQQDLQLGQQQLQQGHVKGIHQQLDRMLDTDQSNEDFVTELRSLAREFQLQAMSRLVARALQAEV